MPWPINFDVKMKISTIVYGKRKYLKVRIRKIKHFLFKKAKKVIKRFSHHNEGTINTLLIYPMLTDSEKYLDLLNRTAWAFPKKPNLKIYFPMDSNQCGAWGKIKDLKPPKYQYNYLNRDLSHIVFVDKIDRNQLNQLQPDVILVHDTSLKAVKSILSKIHNVEIIDKSYYSYIEAGIWQNFFYQTFSKKERQDFENLSKRNFLSLSERCRGKQKAYCFTTGPSFNNYTAFHYEDNSLKIICNSIVKDKEFLEYIKKPDLLVFADPAFHFGPSEYAGVFRKYVMAVIERYDCFVMVPNETVPLMITHYPKIADRIIGMNEEKEFNFPTIDKFWVKSYNNILIKYMLPTASTFADEIYIIGADGRGKNENYFWKHSSLVQFDDLMDSVFHTHPSFFRDRLYSDFYKMHCKNLEEMLQYGEARGKKYYSLMPSRIPALGKRYFKNKERSQSDQKVFLDKE